MMQYQFLISKQALKELQALPAPLKIKIKQKLYALQLNPLINGTRKLAGLTNCYRLRQGDYRILYVIEDSVVKVTNIVHRREAYR